MVVQPVDKIFGQVHKAVTFDTSRQLVNVILQSFMSISMPPADHVQVDLESVWSDPFRELESDSSASFLLSVELVHAIHKLMEFGNIISYAPTALCIDRPCSPADPCFGW